MHCWMFYSGLWLSPNTALTQVSYYQENCYFTFREIYYFIVLSYIFVHVKLYLSSFVISKSWLWFFIGSLLMTGSKLPVPDRDTTRCCSTSISSGVSLLLTSTLSFAWASSSKKIHQHCTITNHPHSLGTGGGELIFSQMFVYRGGGAKSMSDHPSPSSRPSQDREPP